MVKIILQLSHRGAILQFNIKLREPYYQKAQDTLV